MNKNQTLIALNQLRKEIYETRKQTGDEHYSYLGGKIQQSIHFVDTFFMLTHKNSPLDVDFYLYMDERIRQLAKEFHDYKGGNHKYEDFGGIQNEH